MKLFIVTWSTASVDDRNNVQSFNGIDGIFKDRASAEQALETEAADIDAFLAETWKIPL